MVLFWNSKHMIRQSLQKCHKKVRGTFNRTFQTKKKNLVKGQKDVVIILITYHRGLSTLTKYH